MDFSLRNEKERERGGRTMCKKGVEVTEKGAWGLPKPSFSEKEGTCRVSENVCVREIECVCVCKRENQGSEKLLFCL